ncbi:LPS biosynthesis protein [Methanococcoides methylutens]|uniref:LPS biosynthesis protein n=1 Tax=Methanococcoides methylutens TaxID=2226 RepID=A0A099T2J1_METMT|nr:glycosyltransferase family 4 protein [Methanococcoides methylutens]KGK98388.1 LPS biosynthesis protein [Methanococcoides methylutens]
MKIAQICPRYAPDIGGVETHVKEISERLAQKGHSVDVITTDPSGKLPKEEIINGVNVIRFKSFAPGNAYFLAPQVYSYLKSREYDVVHAHSYHAFPAFFAALAKPGNKFVFTPHYHRSGHTYFRNLLHKPYKLFGRMIFTRADTIICVSEFEKGLVTDDFNVSGKIEKIPNGINLAEFEKLKPQKDESDEKTLLYVGRLEKYKGVQYIIQALPELTGFRFRIVGKGPYEDELRNLADQVGVSDRIEWLKGISRYELLQCYASADVFLMLSKHEAYGITVAEALASGTPCIVARGSALDEFVDGGYCVGVDIPISKESFSGEIKMLISNVDTKRDSSKKLMDWDEVAEKTEDVYQVTQV